jgi:hypothetical protein
VAGDDATIEGVVGGKEEAPSHSFGRAFEGALRTVRHTAMRMVDADPKSVEAQLRAGEIACLGCGPEATPGRGRSGMVVGVFRFGRDVRSAPTARNRRTGRRRTCCCRTWRSCGERTW